MSGPGEERWRGGRPYDQNRHSAQRHSNARTMSAHGGSRGGQNNWGDSRDQFASGPQQEQHVPVRGFNAAEAKGALRKGREQPRERTLGRKTYVTTSPGNNSTKHTINDLTRTTTYTANQMANGKDFFLELRKQVTALQQGGTVAGG
ncbi:hypothetical protein RIB2604_00602510 [Aspergillus luchuensis]|uniref:Uncharacterized protein n=1 Tax=Aspergillus kawachii TaxID=1069201 RepID=A0A146F1P4_ASPKA|nr:hypothetical protein RIB2604_00602510 [Aspergillus luchuensis]